MSDTGTAGMPVHPDLGTAFAQIVNTAHSWSPQRAGELQTTYESYWSRRVERAGDRVHEALERAHLSRNFDPSPTGAWVYVDELCYIVGGAADVAQAVLAREHILISRRDYDRLTAWWVAAGLPLPDGPDFVPAVTFRGAVRMGLRALGIRR